LLVKVKFRPTGGIFHFIKRLKVFEVSRETFFQKVSFAALRRVRNSLFALQAGAALGDRFEGVKSPLPGDFCSFASYIIILPSVQ
jgi:hypothetical protein